MFKKLIVLLLVVCAWSLYFFLPHPSRIKALTPSRPFAPLQLKKPHIIRTLPHDTSAFTQGLFFDNGFLYESDGLYSASRLRVIDTHTGAVTYSTICDPSLFCEGLARNGDKMVQLTWQNNIALVYSFPALTLLGTVPYNGEGWGLTHDGTHYIMSNGSDTLLFRNNDFSISRRVCAVVTGGHPLTSLNELEYARGLIYANVWYSSSIFAISPATGAVVSRIDCDTLVNLANTGSDDEVLNGIAYDPQKNTFYLTGKKWRYIFEVSI